MLTWKTYLQWAAQAERLEDSAKAEQWRSRAAFMLRYKALPPLRSQEELDRKWLDPDFSQYATPLTAGQYLFILTVALAVTVSVWLLAPIVTGL